MTGRQGDVAVIAPSLHDTDKQFRESENVELLADVNEFSRNLRNDCCLHQDDKAFWVRAKWRSH